MAKARSIFTAPWYPWYVRDVLTSERVDLMSLAEEGAYRRALDKAWMVGSVPADAKDLATVIGNRCTVKIAERVLQMFVEMPGRPDRMINPRLEKVRKEQEQKYKNKSKTGKENIAKRWNKKTSGDSNAIATVYQPDSIQNQIQIKNKEEDLRGATALPSERETVVEAEIVTKPEDPRKIHPAIVAVHEVVGLYPPKEIWDALIERLGSDADPPLLKKCFTAWRVRGYNKMNYDWTEWYHEGIPKAGKLNGTNRNANGHKPTPGEVIANRPYR